jgi:aldehyde dehydrogenase (NAD+)
MEHSYRPGRSSWTSTYFKPAILLNPGLDNKVYREEIFGPVLCVRTFKDEDEAVKLANDSRFGLECEYSVTRGLYDTDKNAATIYTSDMARAMRMAGKIDAGTIGINTGFVPNKATPFGGWKESGIGREGGSEGIKGYLQAKTIHINLALQS